MANKSVMTSHYDVVKVALAIRYLSVCFQVFPEVKLLVLCPSSGLQYKTPCFQPHGNCFGGKGHSWDSLLLGIHAVYAVAKPLKAYPMLKACLHVPSKSLFL